MTDWAAYDTIAARYDDVWGPRFEAVARLIWEHVLPAPGSIVLDIGTGTAVVPRALVSRRPEIAAITGCDRSPGMMRVARSRMPALRLVAADAASLPFRDAAFDVVTASFVLSHLPDHEAGLSEAHRVLKPGGRLAVTSWATDTDAQTAVWRGLVTDAISKESLEAAAARVAPSESQLLEARSVESALLRSGFASVEVHAHPLESRTSIDQFLADRELSSGGRYARYSMGEEGWKRFLERARVELGRRFGEVFTFGRGVLIGVGRREG
jgi:ubiquinone/menaquinone biosynthesis C-methylase UbiE